MPTFASFDGTRLHYEDQGDGASVVLLHGFAADAGANWVAPGVVAALLAAGRRVISPDARGHGQSDRPHHPSAYEDDAMVRDVQALFDHLGLERADVVGYSMGSFVTSALVGHEPRIRSIVLGGVGIGIARGAASIPGLADALETEDPSTITDPTAKAFRRFAERTGADRLALAALQRAERRHGPPDLGAIGVPTLVLTGDGDTLVGSPHELGDAVPGAKVQIVAGDHLAAVLDPAFPAAIVDFLADVDAGR
jgi:pimeloyl-ACP methyl ester carboxylesterase